MSEKQQEQILAVPTVFVRQLLADGGDMDPGVYHGDQGDIVNLWDHANFVDRGPAEDNPELKQLITYALVTYKGKVLCYKRGKVGQEARLHAKLSIGVGGHVNPVDHEPEEGDPTDQLWVLNALRRELQEEIGITGEHVSLLDFLGFVNEDTTDVGSVHLGVVVRVDLRNIEGLTFEDSLLEPRWLTVKELFATKDLEFWSKIIRNHLGEDTKFLQVHEMRVVGEAMDNQIKIDKLICFLDSPAFAEFRANDEVGASLLIEQARVMHELGEILHQRVDRF